ncbi:hypothetical protein ABBQ38_011500 [Trebouxia sp. C0009 RCD-2024]
MNEDQSLLMEMAMQCASSGFITFTCLACASFCFIVPQQDPLAPFGDAYPVEQPTPGAAFREAERSRYLQHGRHYSAARVDIWGLTGAGDQGTSPPMCWR